MGTNGEIIGPKCEICGQEADDSNSVECSWCGNRFHLTIMMGIQKLDCGRIYLGQEYLAYMCDICVKSLNPPEPLLAPRLSSGMQPN